MLADILRSKDAICISRLRIILSMVMRPIFLPDDNMNYTAGVQANKYVHFVIGLFVMSCAPGHPSANSTLPSPAVTIHPAASTATVTPIPSPTLTAQQAIYPHTIAGLRKHNYESGRIRVLEELLVTRNFTRYLIEYPSDGLTITGVMQVPVQGRAPFPVIIMNHGFFARSVYASGDGTDRAAEYFNRHGYLTISPDYRSWGGSQSGISLYYSGLVIDVINLLNAVPTVPQADPERIGMWGHSMGGGVTMKVLAVEAGRVFLDDSSVQIETHVRAAVLYSTVSAEDVDILERWGPGCLGDVLAGEQQYGCNSSDVIPLDLPADLIHAYLDSPANPDVLEQVSAFHHLDLVTIPVQINYGSDDGKTLAGTPPEWSRKLHQGLLAAGKHSELYGYVGEGHSFIGDEWVAVMERSAHFFDRYVKNAP
jgi:pimeloyl-ACP methyl ester carboxylesterase